MNKVAICVPTRNNVVAIREVLEFSADIYKEMQIDVYYFDSSESDETYNVIKEYQQLGYENLFHVKLDSDTNLAVKMDMIYKCNHLKRKYEYVWPVKDRVAFPKDTLLRVFESIEEKNDAIMLGVFDTGISKDTVYDKPEEFYRDWGWIITSLDVILYRYDTMLSDYRTEDFFDTRYDKHMSWWSLYIFPFHKFARLKKVMIKVLVNPQFVSSQSGKSLTWMKEIFEIWEDCWIKVNDELPDCYNPYKDKIIRTPTALPWIFGGTARLQELHDAQILTPENCDHVLQNWSRISDIPPKTVREIAYGIYDIRHDTNLLNKFGNKTIDLLTQIIERINNETAKIEDIPVEDLEKCVLLEIENKKCYPMEVVYLLEGTLEDIKKYITDKSSTKIEICNALQMVAMMLVLAN